MKASESIADYFEKKKYRTNQSPKIEGLIYSAASSSGQLNWLFQGLKKAGKPFLLVGDYLSHQLEINSKISRTLIDVSLRLHNIDGDIFRPCDLIEKPSIRTKNGEFTQMEGMLGQSPRIRELVLDQIIKSNDLDALSHFCRSLKPSFNEYIRNNFADYFDNMDQNDVQRIIMGVCGRLSGQFDPFNPSGRYSNYIGDVAHFVVHGQCQYLEMVFDKKLTQETIKHIIELLGHGKNGADKLLFKLILENNVDWFAGFFMLNNGGGLDFDVKHRVKNKYRELEYFIASLNKHLYEDLSGDLDKTAMFVARELPLKDMLKIVEKNSSLAENLYSVRRDPEILPLCGKQYKSKQLSDDLSF